MVPDITIIVGSGVSGESRVSSIASVWSISVIEHPLRISFCFTLANMVDTRVGIVKSVVCSVVDWGGYIVVDFWDVSVVSIVVYSSTIKVLGVSFGITLAKMVDTCISVVKSVVDSIVYSVVGIIVDDWRSNSVVDLWNVSVISVAVNSCVVDGLRISFSFTFAKMVKTIWDTSSISVCVS